MNFLNRIFEAPHGHTFLEDRTFRDEDVHENLVWTIKINSVHFKRIIKFKSGTIIMNDCYE